MRSSTISAITLPLAVLAVAGHHAHVLGSLPASLMELPWLAYWLITVIHWAWTGEILWRIPDRLRRRSRHKDQ